jgi:hypothetical protein
MPTSLSFTYKQTTLKNLDVEDYYLKGAMEEIICVTSFLLAL